MPVRARPRAFTVLLASEFVSLVGDRLAMVALIALVYAETRSPAVVALLMLVRAIPAVALGGLAGSVVDRFDRRAVMVTANVVQGFVVLSIPALGNVTLVIAAYAVMSIVNQFFIPARSATIPDLVDSDGLSRANAAFGAAFVGALAVGPVIGGLIADRYGLAAAFYADSVTFFVPAVAVGLLRFPARTSQAAAQRSSLVGDTMAALRHAAAVPEVYRALAAQAGAALVIAVLSVIGVVVASDSLGLSTGGYGAMMSAMGVGMLLGALVLGRRSAPGAGSRSYAAPLGLVVAGAGAALLAWLTSPALAMVASAGVGAGVLAVQIRSQTVLQSSAADLRARLISLGQSVSGLAQIVATVLTAGVAALAGAPWVLTGTGFVAAALGVFLLVDALPTPRTNRNPT